MTNRTPAIAPIRAAELGLIDDPPQAERHAQQSAHTGVGAEARVSVLRVAGLLQQLFGQQSVMTLEERSRRPVARSCPVARRSSHVTDRPLPGTSLLPSCRRLTESRVYNATTPRKRWLPA